MKVHDPGILNTSDIYFHTSSAQAKQMFFYLLCTGHYFCDKDYLVDRQNYSSFLVLYVNSGSGFIEHEGKRLALKAGSVAFIDCYKPHKYYTKTKWETYWIHFDGVLARQYYQLITEEGVVLVPKTPYHVMRSLRKIFASFHENNKTNEALISKYITDLLTEMLLCVNENNNSARQLSVVEEALSYISENTDKPLLLDDLAKRVSLSPYYFTRIFKKETGFTPHEYLIRARIDLAKFFLKTTKLPVKEIAFRSGFSTESGFCTAFKKLTGFTPKSYRAQEV